MTGGGGGSTIGDNTVNDGGRVSMDQANTMELVETCTDTLTSVTTMAPTPTAALEDQTAGMDHAFLSRSGPFAGG